MALYNKFFYNEVIRKYVASFGSLFSNIYVIRKNTAGTEIGREIVPLTYAPKEKFIQRLEQDKNGDTKVAVKLPHIAFEISSYTYDPDRKITSKRRICQPGENGTDFFYNPVPYNIDFTMYVFAKTQEEGLQIIEQIVPFFTPDYPLTLKLTDLDTYKQDTPISLVSISSEDTYEGRFEERRSIIWTLSFVLKGYLIGPKRTANRILSASLNMIIEGNEQPVVPTVFQKATTIDYSSTFENKISYESYIELTNSADSPNLTLYRGKLNQFTVFIVENDADYIIKDNDVFEGKIRLNFSDPNPVFFTVQKINDSKILVVIDDTILNQLTESNYIFDITVTDNDSTTLVVDGRFTIV